MRMEEKKPGVGFGAMVLNKQGQVLLGRRHKNPDKADSEFRVSDVWTMPGGKLKYGESFEEGAIRETLEETGIVLKNLKIICINEDINEFAHFITIGLISENCEQEPKVMEPEEIIEWKWFNLNEIPNNIYFPSAKVLNNYKYDKFYIKDNWKE